MLYTQRGEAVTQFMSNTGSLDAIHSGFPWIFLRCWLDWSRLSKFCWQSSKLKSASILWLAIWSSRSLYVTKLAKQKLRHNRCASFCTGVNISVSQSKLFWTFPTFNSIISIVSIASSSNISSLRLLVGLFSPFEGTLTLKGVSSSAPFYTTWNNR